MATALEGFRAYRNNKRNKAKREGKSVYSKTVKPQTESAPKIFEEPAATQQAASNQQTTSYSSPLEAYRASKGYKSVGNTWVVENDRTREAREQRIRQEALKRMQDQLNNEVVPHATQQRFVETAYKRGAAINAIQRQMQQASNAKNSSRVDTLGDTRKHDKYTEYNLSDSYYRTRYLANKQDWTPEEEAEAREIYDTINGDDKYNMITNITPGGERLAGLIADDPSWRKVYDTLDARLHPIRESVGYGFAQGTGANSIADVLGGKSQEYQQRVAPIAAQHPVAAGAGSAAGGLYQMLTLGAAAEGIPLIQGLPRAAQMAAIRGGASAIGEAGDVATGRISPTQYAADILVNAGAGAAGSAAANYITGAAGNLITKYPNLRYNPAIRAGLAGLYGGSYSAVGDTTKQLARMLGYKDGQNVTPAQIARDAAVNAAFGTINFILRGGIQNTFNEGRTASGQPQAVEEKYFKGVSDEDLKSVRNDWARRLHSDQGGSEASDAEFAAMMKEYNYRTSKIADRAYTAYNTATQAKADGNMGAYEAADREFKASVDNFMTVYNGENITPDMQDAINAIVDVVNTGIDADIAPTTTAVDAPTAQTTAPTVPSITPIGPVVDEINDQLGSPFAVYDRTTQEGFYTDPSMDASLKNVNEGFSAEDLDPELEAQLRQLAESRIDTKEAQRQALYEAGRKQNQNLQQLMNNSSLLSDEEKIEAVRRGNSDKTNEELNTIRDEVAKKDSETNIGKLPEELEAAAEEYPEEAAKVFLENYKSSVPARTYESGFYTAYRAAQDGIPQEEIESPAYNALTKAQQDAAYQAGLTGLSNADDPEVPADESGIQMRINRTMTMKQAENMIQSAWGLVRDWYDGEYKTAFEWIENEGSTAVADQIENDRNLYERYISHDDGLREYEYSISDVVDAYLAGTLIGHEKAKPVRLDVSRTTGMQDDRFYAPKQDKVTRTTYDLAISKANGKNKEDVFNARKEILFAAHSTDLATELGIKPSELNKRLRSWSNYPKSAISTSMRINNGVAPENQWTGIQNSSILSRMTVTDDDIRRTVKEVIGSGSQYERNYIARTMLAIDTHTDWSWLTVEFVKGRVDQNRPTVRGQYYRGKIRIGASAGAETVAHEMGHALDYKWERDIFGNHGQGQPLSSTTLRENLAKSPEALQFFKNFRTFMQSLYDVNDTRSAYTNEPTEVFARFVAKFVEWVDETAGNSFYKESLSYNDRFNTSQYVEFAKLLQEKAMLDGAGLADNGPPALVEAGVPRLFEDSDFTYDNMIKKPDMAVTRVNASDVEKDQKDLLREARQNVKDNSIDGGNKIYVADLKAPVIVGRTGINHGIVGRKRNWSNNAIVAPKIGEVLKNAILINELSPRSGEKENNGGYLLIGIASDQKNLYPTLLNVQNNGKNKFELTDYDLLNLYSSNSKKIELQPTGTLVIGANPEAISTLSKISIKDLLGVVKKTNPDVLPKNIANAMGFERPDGVFTEKLVREKQVPGQYRLDVDQIEGQLKLNFDNQSDEQRKLSTKAVKSLMSLRDANGKVVDKGIALTITKELMKSGKTELIGKKAKNVDDMAALAQVYRDPRFETLRYFFTDKNGNIVFQTAVSSGLPNVSFTVPSGENEDNYFTKLVSAAKEQGAVNVYMLHNHPSGLVKPSNEDINTTGKLHHLFNNLGVKLQGSIVIDHTEYAVMDKITDTDLQVDVRALPEKAINDLGDVFTPAKRNALLGTKISNPDDVEFLAKAEKMSENSNEIISLFFADAQNRVRVIQQCGTGMLDDTDGFMEHIRSVAKGYGSPNLFIVTRSEDSYDGALTKLYQEGTAQEVLLMEGTDEPSFRSMFTEQGRAAQANEASFMGESIAGMRVGSAVFELTPDQEYGMQRLEENNTSVSAMNDALRNAVAGKVGAKADPKEAAKIARKIRSEYKSDIDVTNLANNISSLYDYMSKAKKNKAREIASVAKDIGASVLEQSTEMDDSLAQLYPGLKKGIKTYKVGLSDVDKKELSYHYDNYNNFRRMAFNRLTLTKPDTKGAVSADTAYQELNEMYPELFPDDITDTGNQIIRMYEVSKMLDPQPISTAFGMSTDEFDSEAYLIGQKILRGYFDAVGDKNYGRILEQTIADVKAESIEKIAAMRASNAKKIQKLRDKMDKAVGDEKEKRKEQLARLRADKNGRIEEIEQNYRNLIAKARARKADSKTRAELLKKANKAVRLAKNRPGYAADAIKDLVKDLDLVSVGMRDATREKLQQKYREILEMREQDPNYKALHSEKDMQRVDRLFKKQIKDMDLDDVKDLITELSALIHYQETQDKLFKDSKGRDAAEAGRQWVKDLNEMKPLDISNGAKQLIAKYLRNNLSPERAARMISGYKRGSIAEELIRNLEDGLTKQKEFEQKADNLFRPFIEDKANRDFVKNASKQTIQISDSEGNTAMISPAMRVAIYMHRQNTDNMNHIKSGGVTIPNPKLYEQGKIRDAYNRGRTLKLQPMDLDEIINDMTQSEMQYALLLQTFFDDYAQNAINETSLTLDGIYRAIVDRYFPISTDPNFLAKAMDLTNDPTLEGWGNLKARQEGAINPILLEDVTKVLQRHIRKTGQYVGLAIPLRDFQKVYGYTSSGYETSVQKAIGNIWDEDTKNYLTQFITDLNTGGRQAERGIVENLRSVYAGSVLTLNPSVALKQTTSYFMAGSILDVESLIKGLGSNFTKEDQAYMDSITPWGWARRQGQSTIELGDLARQNDSLANKVPNWNQSMDVWTTNKLFKATEENIKKEYPGLKRGDKDYDKALAEKYNQVLWRTQPQYEAMFRPEYLRRTDLGSRTFGMFKTESMQMSGELIDAWSQWIADSGRAKNGDDQARRNKSESARNFAKTFCSWVASNMAFAIMGTSLNILLMHKGKQYRNKNGEIDWNTILEKTALNFAGSSVGGFFYASTLFDAGQYLYKAFKGEKSTWYDIEAPGLPLVNDTVSSLGNLIGYLVNPDATTETKMKAAAKFGLNVSKFTSAGFAENLVNIINSVILYKQDIEEGTIGRWEAGDGLLSDSSPTKDQYANMAINAAKNGDYKTVSRALGRTKKEQLAKALGIKVNDAMYERYINAPESLALAVNAIESGELNLSDVPDKGFNSYEELRVAYGNGERNQNLHHIVEQEQAKSAGNNLANFDDEKVQNFNNVVSIPSGASSVHGDISKYYRSKQDFTNGKTVREWLASKSFDEQWEFGMNKLREYGSVVPTKEGWMFSPDDEAIEEMIPTKPETIAKKYDLTIEVVKRFDTKIKKASEDGKLTDQEIREATILMMTEGVSSGEAYELYASKKKDDEHAATWIEKGYDFGKYLDGYNTMSEAKEIKDSDKKRDEVVKYLKGYNGTEEEKHILWELAGYAVDAKKDGKTVKNGNYDKWMK